MVHSLPWGPTDTHFANEFSLIQVQWKYFVVLLFSSLRLLQNCSHVPKQLSWHWVKYCDNHLVATGMEVKWLSLNLDYSWRTVCKMVLCSWQWMVEKRLSYLVIHWYIEARTKVADLLQMTVSNSCAWKKIFRILIQISLKFVLSFSIDRKWAVDLCDGLVLTGWQAWGPSQ